MKKLTVLVTGANGFIGRCLVPMLEERGYGVRRAVRTGTASDNSVAIGSIGPFTNWEAAVAGVDAVVHLAARVHRPNEEHAGELYNMVNAEGTLQLACAAERANVRKFVFLSSILVNGSCTDGRAPFNENDTFCPRGAYGQSKAAAELGLQELASKFRMSVSIVRPPLVYGREAGGNFRQLVTALKMRLPLPLGLIDNRRSFIGVQNLGSFISMLLDVEQRVQCKTYLVADAEQISTAAFIRRMGRALNRHAVLLPIPPKLVDLAVKTLKPRLRDSLFGSLEMDISSALSIGWRAPFNIEESLKLALGPL